MNDPNPPAGTPGTRPLSPLSEEASASNMQRVQADLSSALGAVTSLTDALGVVLDATCSIQGILGGSAYVVDETTNALRRILQLGPPRIVGAQPALYPPDSDISRLVLAGVPAYESRLSRPAPSPEEPERVALAAEALIPLHYAGRPVAAVHLIMNSAETPSPALREALEILTAQLSGVIARLKDEEALRRSQQDLQRFFDTLDDFLFILDEAGCIVRVNRTLCRRLGYTAEEVVGKHVGILHPPARRAEIQAIIAAMLAGQATTHSVPLIARDGRQIPVETRVRPGSWAGQPVLFGASRDVSDRQHTEQILRRHDAILEAVSFAAERFLTTSDWESDLTEMLAQLGRAADVSRAYVCEVGSDAAGGLVCQRTYEWTAPGITPQAAGRDACLLPSAEPGISRWLELFRKGQPVRGHTRQMPAGEREALQAQGIRSFLAMPVFVGAAWWGFIGFDVCLAEREWTFSMVEALQTAARILSAGLQSKRMELSLRQNQARTQAILDALPDLIFRVDRRGAILDCKAGNEFRITAPAGDRAAQNLADWLPAEIADLLLQRAAQALDSGQRRTVEYRLPAPQDDQAYEARLVGSGEDEALIVIRNVTERTMLEQMQADFVNRAAHELRTPLSTMMLMADLIQEGGSQAETQRYWTILRAEMDRQKGLVEQLLTMGRLESGAYRLRIEALDLAPILRQALELAAPQAAARQIQLDSEIPAMLPPVHADKRGLMEILANLLGNAVKFTPAGGAGRVRLEALGREGQVCVRVRDNGIGIAPEDMPSLFQRFFRGGNTLRHEIPGSGVGLYIVKQLVEQMHGRVNVQSDSNQGTVFEVMLPAATPYSPWGTSAK